MKLRLTNIIKETHDTKTFRFIPQEKFNFKPGQFIVFIMNDKEGEFRRAFSIANSPDEKEFIEITVKKAPKGRASTIFFEKTKINSENCITQAKKFSKERFISEIRGFVEKNARTTWSRNN